MQSGSRFEAFFAPVVARMHAGGSMFDARYDRPGGLRGRALFEARHAGFAETAARCRDIDPKARLKWAGPAMSAGSSIAARQIGTRAHGQDIFDVPGKVRRDTDRIRDIARLGVTTFGWTFVNRGEEAPDPPPFVTPTAPSGAVREWNGPQDRNSAYGTASEFRQGVTQVRTITDTSVRTRGAGAPDGLRTPGAQHIADVGQGERR